MLGFLLYVDSVWNTLEFVRGDLISIMRIVLEHSYFGLKNDADTAVL